MKVASTRLGDRGGRRRSGAIDTNGTPPAPHHRDHIGPSHRTGRPHDTGADERGSPPGHRLSWRWPTLLALVSLLPLAGLLAAPAPSVSTAVTLTGLTVLLGATLAATLFYATRFVSGVTGHEWLAALLLVIGISDLPFAIAMASGSAETAFASGESTESVAMLAVLCLLIAARRGTVLPLRTPPIVVGVVIAAGIAALRFGATRLGIDAWLVENDLVAPQRLFTAVVAVAVVIAVGHLGFLALHLRRRLQAVAIGLGLGHTLDSGQFGGGWPDLATSSLKLAVITVLLGIAAQVFHSALMENRTHLAEWSGRAAEASRSIAADQELRHELRSAIGGISSASELLLWRSGELTDRERELLHRAVRSELARLGRMTSDDHHETGMHRLDELIEPVIAAHRAGGLDVTSTVGPELVHTRPDHLAEVLTTLLQNAARHAPGGRVNVSVQRHPGFAALRVYDDGPGIAPHLNAKLFGRGAIGPDSAGSGLGLYVARRLMRDHGGDLLLDPDQHQGTAFVVRVPVVEELAQ